MISYKQEIITDCLQRTFDPNPIVRRKAVREMCPCKVQKEIDQLWNRLLEMVTDEDASIRYEVVHVLCDGSPKDREESIVGALEKMWNDTDLTVRRRVRRALGEYRRSGNWNIL